MNETIYKACLNKEENNKSWSELAEEFGYENFEKLRAQFRREYKRRNEESQEDEIVSKTEDDFDDTPREKTSYTETDNGLSIICSSPRIKTKEDVIREFNVDESVWKIKSFTIKTSEGYRKDRKVKWEVEDGVVTHGSVNDTGRMLVVPLYHTKTEMIRKTSEDIDFSGIEDFFKKLESQSSKNKTSLPKTNIRSTGKVLEIDLADIHVGNDTSIESTQNKLNQLLVNLIEKMNGKTFEKIMVVQLGDLFHFDTYNRTTTSGTGITTSTKYFTMWEKGVEMLIDFIEGLSLYAPVEVINVYGNHDRVSSFTAAKSLELYFRNSDTVEVDANHDKRKYRKIGRSLVGFVHGDMPKNNVYSLLQREARNMFAETDFFELHLGHFHHEHSLEKDGVIIRYVPTSADTDEWHNDQGYTGNKKATCCFVWDVEKGLEEQWWINA